MELPLLWAESDEFTTADNIPTYFFLSDLT